MSDRGAGEYVLGIDLGTNSLGWAMIALVDGEPHHLIRAGVRVFDAGMEGDIASGRDESRNLKRRQMRLQRRQTWRRARRLRKIFNLLRRYGMLPVAGPQRGNSNSETSEARQDLINELDQTIRHSAWFKAKAASGKYPEPEQTMPYMLRAAALDEELEPQFLGRALYHLAQRRGFLSNRKQIAKGKDDDEGKVKEGIAKLRKLMEESNARTLGEYFSGLAPSEQRIRSRWTARDLYEKEFDAVWAAQAKHRPDLLSEERRKELRRALFHQRPLWFDPNTIGKCELEPGERRAPRSSFVAQRFRVLDAVNNLRIELPEGGERPLAEQERAALIQALELEGDHTFAQARKLLQLPKHARFTVERGGETTLRGNRTTAAFYGVFGERWLEMSAEEHDRALGDVLSIQKEDALRRRGIRHWKLDEEAAKRFAEISPESDHFGLSRRAIERLLPDLEAGLSLAEARKKLYPESFQSSAPRPLLPAVEFALTEIRNPAVMRSLTELRKVVNAVVRQHGKPQEIRVELARDLKKSKKQREAISENNRRNEKSRAEAAKKIFDELNVKGKADDIRKVLLWEECHRHCPYTGNPISMRELLGPEPQFDIEHIIPFSRSMDNSFQNLTLCYIPENRNVKGNRTPHQAYSGDPARYAAILDRVKKFSGELKAAKLRRFSMNDDELEIWLEDFRKRQLNDTAYAASLAAKYLGSLYGGVSDAGGKRRVQTTSGQTTSYFRNLWKLNSILNDGPTTDGGYQPKSRDDHRHHAVDAVVVGLTDAGMVKRLSDAAQRAPQAGRKRFAPLEGPWPNFTESVRAEIEKIVVSHRVSKKVSGALHEETIYSAPMPDGRVRVRKPLAALTKNEVEDIADPRVKALVLAKLNGGEPKKVFAAESNLPCFETKDGRRIPIKRVRVNKAVPTFALGAGRTARHAATDSNHHVEIYAELDRSGNEGKWGGEVVPMQEAYRRLKAGKPVVRRDHGPLVRFKFSLGPGEVIECDDGKGGRALWVSRGVASYDGGPRLLLSPMRDARKKKDLLKAGVFWSPFLNPLRKLNPRKLTVGPLGEVSEAHD